MQRLSRQDAGMEHAAQHRLKQVNTELDNLHQNLLAGIASPVLRAMIAEREAEKKRLEAQRAATTTGKPIVVLQPHPVLLDRFRSKVAALRQSLDDGTIRTEAAAVMSTLIESVTICPDECGGLEAEVVAKVSDLLAWATNDNATREGGVLPRFDKLSWLRGQDLTADSLSFDWRRHRVPKAHEMRRASDTTARDPED